MKTKLSKRLLAVANLVSENRVADVGCDHGKLIEYLFENNVIEYAFVSDISAPSVNKAKQLLGENSRNFDWAVADGLAGVNTEHKINEVVISGMGGLEIIKILKNNHLNIKSFVLQPQNNEILLKKYLIKNKYHILRDFIVKDKNIYYNILKVVKQNHKQKISKFDLCFGKENFNGNNDFYLYIVYLKEKYEKILLNVPFKNKFAIKNKLKTTQKAIRLWEKVNGKNITISKN